MVLSAVRMILQHLVGILFLYFVIILKLAIWVFDSFLPTSVNLFAGNEASQPLLDNQVEKGFSFVEEHGLSSTTPIARRNVQPIQHITSPQPFVKRKSPRLSAQKNVVPKKLPEKIVDVVDEVLPSSSDGK